ncbi:MAG: hypothetical protein IT184_03620 [Acidobacteria bacterium]|nr:hypothetical protein [Acidobacteriota bacterium]
MPDNRRTAVFLRVGIGLWVVVGALAGGAAGPAAGLRAAAELRPAAGVPAQAGDDLSALLTMAGLRVAEFFTRAERLVCLERVVMQPLTVSLSNSGPGRVVESELRVSWDPGAGGAAVEATMRRQVLKVNGRAPRPDDRNRCTTPELEATETQPLSMLLPARRDEYAFSLAGTARVEGRLAALVDYRELGQVRADVKTVDGVEDCVSFDVTGGRRGRLWIDRASGDVLRLDHRLPGMIDLRLPAALVRRPGAAPYLTLERSDTSIRFGRVTFRDPDESLVLPLESSEFRVMRNGGTPRLRTVTTYTDYKRFLTDGRLIDAAPN